MKQAAIRLTPYVRPTTYTLYIHTDIEKGMFYGKVLVSIVLERPEKSIVLHSKNLAYTSIVLQQGDTKKEGVVSIDTEKETATCSFGSKIEKGTALLYIEFSGALEQSMRGFYRSSYEYKGKAYPIATTQFEATDARRAFPCFDEPAMKAVFNITLSVPTGMTALSNTPCLSTKKDEEYPGYSVHRFAPTPHMSSYLVAYVIGDFEYIEGSTARGLPVRVYTPLGKKEDARFALSVATGALDFYEKYFGIRYPLAKLDMIALPDFEAGAMENWGLVTYRETALLVNKTTTSNAAREWVALVIAHELAHQWFGNLVTMEWWTDLWLNEGFASYIEYVAVDALFPEWHIWERFVVADLGRALVLDGLQHTHPIEVVVHDPNEIGEIFDAISYSKGASVIRMLAEHVGAIAFRNGLRRYLKQHAYKNTRTVDLWKSLGEASLQDVEGMMKGWTMRAGHPILSIEKHREGLRISQERFYASPAQHAQEKTLPWSTPVSFLLSGGTRIEKRVISKKSEVLDIPFDKVIKLNAQETGVYRSHYTSEMLLRLSKGELKTMSVADRIGVFRDAGALVQKGELPISDYMACVLSSREETDYNVWISIIETCRYIRNIFWDHKDRHAFDLCLQDLLSERVTHALAPENKKETHGEKLLRPLILSLASSCGEPRVLLYASELWKTKNIPANLRAVVYTTIVREGGRGEYNKMLALYKQESSSEEKKRILAALMSAQQESLHTKNMKLLLSKEVRAQDLVGGFAACMGNQTSRNMAYLYMKEEWETLHARYKGGHSLTYVIDSLAVFSDMRMYKDIQRFFKNKDIRGIERTIQQTLETVEAQARVQKIQAKSFARFVKRSLDR